MIRTKSAVYDLVDAWEMPVITAEARPSVPVKKVLFASKGSFTIVREREKGLARE